MYFDGFYFSEREHVEHVDGAIYCVPQDVWFTAVRGLREQDSRPGMPDGVLLMASTKDGLRLKLKMFSLRLKFKPSPRDQH